MYVLYLDEFGHDGAWDPTDARHAHHPLFGLAGFAIPGDRCRPFDRQFLHLKRVFFAKEIERAKLVDGLRAERFEHKELANRRDVRFTIAVLRAVEDNEGVVFAFGREKPTGRASDTRLYGQTMQGLMRTFERFLRQKGRNIGRGVVVIDRRTESRDVDLLGWAQSHLYSWDGGFERIVETPLLVRSEWYHGVQAADVIARAIGRVYRYEALKEPRFSGMAAKLRPEIERLTTAIGNRRSVFVKLLPRIEQRLVDRAAEEG